MREEHEHALREDGDGFHRRNYAGIGTIADPAFEALELIHDVQPVTSVLEIGCTTGYRLEKARREFGATAVGLEVSPRAVAEGRALYPHIRLEEGVAPRDLTMFMPQRYDVVIVGYFMYLLPRDDLFALAAAVDGLVIDDGHVIVTDFIHPRPVSAPYSHRDELQVYKHEPSAPWTWSPTYVLVGRRVYDVSENPAACGDPRAWQTVDVLRKLPADVAYPASPTLPSAHEGSV